MNCEEIRRIIQKSLDGTIDPLEETILEAHLMTCESCRRDLALYQALGEKLQNLPEPPLQASPLDALWPKIQKEYREQQGRARKVAERRIWFRRVALISTVLAVMFITFLWGERWTDPSDPNVPTLSELPSDERVVSGYRTESVTTPNEIGIIHDAQTDSDMSSESPMHKQAVHEEGTGETIKPEEKVINVSDPSLPVGINSEERSLPSASESKRLLQSEGRYALVLNEKNVQLFLTLVVQPGESDRRDFSVASISPSASSASTPSSSSTSSAPSPSPSRSPSSTEEEPTTPESSSSGLSSPAYPGSELLWEERLPEKSTDHHMAWLDAKTFQITYRLDDTTWVQIFTIDALHQTVQKKEEHRFNP
ncbi:MAG: zf-HC2 domain-containing protein [Candidatus Carbobacillus altaicus]|nr:zf-HC2 domain-containing protein [Candidatus Carbobacillus altaicus]